MISPPVVKDGGPSARLFVDVTKQGCSTGCLYCYVEQKSEEPISKDQIAQLPALLGARGDFRPGAEGGTLLTFGSHGDMFKPNQFPLFELALKMVAPLGNPIQVATKQEITAEMAFKLACLQAHERQIVVFVSCPVVDDERCKELEPGCAPPDARFRNLRILKDYGVANCLLIKPFILGITSTECKKYVGKINGICRPDVVCVGSLYLDGRIRERMRPHLQRGPTGSSPTCASRLRHPLAIGLDDVRTPTKAFLDALEVGIGEKTPIVQSSPCAVALLQRRPCATRVWENHVCLCNKDACQNCELLSKRTGRPPGQPAIGGL